MSSIFLEGWDVHNYKGRYRIHVTDEHGDTRIYIARCDQDSSQVTSYRGSNVMEFVHAVKDISMGDKRGVAFGRHRVTVSDSEVTLDGFVSFKREDVRVSLNDFFDDMNTVGNFNKEKDMGSNYEGRSWKAQFISKSATGVESIVTEVSVICEDKDQAIFKATRLAKDKLDELGEHADVEILVRPF